MAYGRCDVLQHAVVNLNTINIQDENVAHSSADSVLPDHKVKSSQVTVQPPLSRVLMDTTEPRAVKSSNGPRKEKVPVLTAVKSSSRLRQQKRRLSFSRVREPRSKRLKGKRETAKAAWTESLFVSERLQVGRDVAENVSEVDSRELNREPSRSACSSVVTCTSSVGEDGQLEIASLRENQMKPLQQNPVCSSELASKELNAVASNPADVLTLPATSGEALLQRDRMCDDATTVNVTDEDQSDSTTSGDTCVVKSLPAIKNTPVTHFHDSPPASSPFTAVQCVSSSASSGSRSYPSSTSQTTFSHPVHTVTATSRGMISATSIQVRPKSNINKMPTAAAGHILSTGPGNSTSAQQQRRRRRGVGAVCNVSSQSRSIARQSPPQSQLLEYSDLPPASQSATRALVRPQNTGARLRFSLVPGKQFVPQSSVRQSSSASRSEHVAACSIRQPHSSVSVSASRHLVASGGAVRQQTLSPVTGVTDSGCAVRAIPTRPLVSAVRAIPTRPGVSPPQPVRIRVSATQLGNIADPTAVMDHVRGILSRTNALPADAQIRIRYMPPPTTSSQTQAVQSSHTPQTTTSEHVNTRISQLDGTADSDDEATNLAPSENTGPTSTDVVGTDSVSRGHSRRRSKVAAADETQPTSEPTSEPRVR